jgi:hypothetical protein
MVNSAMNLCECDTPLGSAHKPDWKAEGSSMGLAMFAPKRSSAPRQARRLETCLDLTINLRRFSETSRTPLNSAWRPGV